MVSPKILRVKVLPLYSKVLTYGYHFKILRAFWLFWYCTLGLLNEKFLKCYFLNIAFICANLLCLGWSNFSLYVFTCAKKNWEDWISRSEPPTFTSKPKHLQGNQIYKIGLCNTSGPQNQTKLTYIYNFKKPTKHKPLQLNYEKWVDHVDKMETKM